MAAEGGVVYVGTSRGLYRVDRTGTASQPVAVPGRDPSARITSLLEDSGILWVGGADDGLWKTSIHDGALALLDRWHGGRLTDQRVEVIERGTAQDLWIGTGDGLNRLDRATGAVERIQPNPSDPTALAPGSVSSLLVDRAARLWVGTLGGGISVLTGRDHNGRPLFHRIGAADGLPSANVSQLLLDGQGKIWASTADGLAVIDPGSFAVRALHHAEGVAIAGYWVHSGAVTAQGELLFGGLGGLTVVRPERLRNWSYRPPVVVTDVHIGGKPVPAGRFNGAGSVEPLVLSPQANSLAVEFSALDYSAPERNRYAYRLQGYDRDWIETDATRRLAAYTNLPPGTYTLHLRGSNRDGAWTEKTIDLPITVLPAWYQTLWFRLLLAAAGVAAVAMLVQLRTAFLRQRQRELEQQVEARTAEVVHQKAVAELAHRNIALLSEIGRQITASLDPEAIMDTLYRHVDKLMDASVFGVGLHRAELDLIEFSFAMELGKRYAPYTRSMNAPNQLAVWCIRHRREVFINDLDTEAQRYLPQCEASSINPEHLRLDDGSKPTMSVSMIYAPLLVKDRVLGVICVQSFKRGAYQPVHLDMLRTLASYTAVALDNADAYHELRRTQTQLVQQEKLASLGQLVAGVAHEVNTPVGVALAASTQITLEVERLSDMVASGQLRRAALTDVTTALNDLAELIARNCTRAGTLIQSFKAVAADQSSEERRRFDMRAYVEDVVRSLGPTLHRAHIKLTIEGTHLPTTDRPMIDSYPGALSQVVINLVSNALAHAFEPEQAGAISIRIASRDAGHAELIVRDDGKGIPADVLPKIFDPFFTTRRGSGGTGLGLHIVHNLVAGLLGGAISVETAPGSGTAFLIVLPLSAPTETV
ncbi:MAG TPA: ATP-binding protein [Xanthomonadaceae bacterium]|nr:ATP-binding protein [Xanthomonadaceae bacterium]